MRRPYLLITAAFLLYGVDVVHAAVEESIQFTSTPDGSRVILKQGLKEIDLGTTPVNAIIKFRSSSSIVRVAIRRPGYREEQITVVPDRRAIHVDLARQSFFIDAASYDKQTLADLQHDLESLVDPHFAKDLAASKRFLHVGKIYLQQAGDVVSCVINLQLATRTIEQGETGLDEKGKVVWSALAADFGPTISSIIAVDKVGSLRLHIDMTGTQLKSASTVNRRTQMKWVGGYQYDPVSRTNVYNPLHHQVPVVIEEVEQSGLEIVEDRSAFIYEISTYRTSGDIGDIDYDRISVRYFDRNGKLALSRN